MKFTRNSLLAAAVLMTLAGNAKAQIINNTNVFNNGVTQATVVTTDGYNENPGAFPPSNIDERGTGQFFYADFQNVTLPEQYMSLTGFNAGIGIQAFNFFDGAQYEPGRVATQVTIYYSTSALTGNSLNPADYTALNGGLPYNLPISSTSSDNSYTSGTDVATGINYDTISGLDIPVGTKSILFDFGTNRKSNGDGTGYNVGMGFSEIQAIEATPEPSTWAMMLGGLAVLGFCIRRKSALLKSTPAKLVALAASLFGMSQTMASAQMISDQNVFNNTLQGQATVVTTDGYSYGQFPTSNVDDKTAGAFYYSDQRNVPVTDQYMSMSGFNAGSGINSINFYDGAVYEPERVATQVKIWYSTTANGNSLDPSNYTALNGGLAFNLPISGGGNNSYVSGTDTATGINYDTLSGLGIPAGTESLLFDFGTDRTDSNGFTLGMGFSEIQALGTPGGADYGFVLNGSSVNTLDLGSEDYLPAGGITFGFTAAGPILTSEPGNPNFYTLISGSGSWDDSNASFSFNAPPGYVVARYSFDSFGDTFAVDFQVVPEPSTYALMLGGLAFLGFLARRKNTLVK
jgi:hypothetical protein